MDCHVFRRICAELTPALTGCRLEKIHQPGADVTVFTLYGHGRKRYLFLKAGRKTPFLFLADHKISDGSQPPASVMFLRKHLAGRRVIAAFDDWVERRLYLHFPSSGQERIPDSEQGECGGLWLCLDLREGVRLLRRAPDDPPPPRWPSPEQARAAQGEDWRNWPVLTPALRRTLASLPPEEQAALLLDLEAGGGDLFLYEDEAGRRELFAWPLPEEVRRKRPAPGGNLNERVLENALEAAALAGERRVLRDLADRAGAERARPHLAEAARLRRLLAKLDDDEARLSRMQAAGDDALALQTCLYLFGPDEKQAAVLLPPALSAPETPAPEMGAPELHVPDARGTERPDANQGRRIVLNPRLTVRENMAALFHTARRGKRGLAMLAGRRESVAAELEQAEQAAVRARAGLEGTRKPARSGAGVSASGRPQTPRTLSPGTESARRHGRNGGRDWPKNVQLFRSSDGFLILRGRDAAGNAAVLKLAAPHDLWLHVGGGPGAHVIVRRDHAGQEIPAATLQEAGSLAILKSWKKDESPVDVVRALAGHVHPLRGGRAGETRVDRYEEGLLVSPAPDLEKRLAVGM